VGIALTLQAIETWNFPTAREKTILAGVILMKVN
jgi:hypothetical protein